jgi:predicted secreted protein
MPATTQLLDGVGFISVNKKLVATISDLSLGYDVSTDDVTSMSSNLSKEVVATFKNWSVDCSAFCDSSTTAPASMSGFTSATTFTGTTATLDLITLAASGALVSVVIKLASNKFYRGNAIITKADVKASVGKAMVFSLSLSGSGLLVPSAT